MPRSVTTSLMFEGSAEAAMALYMEAFPGSEVASVERYGPGEVGAEGSVKQATFRVAGTYFACIDSPAAHAFTFTPSISLSVQCADEAELDFACGRLLEGGQALMPPGDYGFSRKFAWVQDRYGVSWQLNLP